MKIFVFLSLILVSCQSCYKDPVEPHVTIQSIKELLPKRDLYLNLMETDSHGFIETSGCDSVLFSSLVGLTSGVVDIPSAKADDGRWYRSPSHDCFPSRSRSSISRDMLIGIMFWLWKHKRIDLLEELWTYGENHNWIMGEGPVDCTWMSFNMRNTLAIMLKKPKLEQDDFWVDPMSDHQEHIVALNIILRGEVEGHISKIMLGLLEEFVKKNPDNSLFQYGVHRYTDGDQKPALKTLSNKDYFPDDHLPTSSNYCTRWLWERANNDDWWPCPSEAKTHSGGDFVFMVGLLEKSR